MSHEVENVPDLNGHRHSRLRCDDSAIGVRKR